MNLISLHTFGCKNNHTDTMGILSKLGNMDCTVLYAAISADVHVINTCTVTASSDAQARNLIRKITKNNLNSLIIITGCSVRRDNSVYQDLIKELKGLNNNELVLCDNLRQDIALYIIQRLGLVNRTKGSEIIDGFRTRYFMSIQDGCDHYCSYCIVPFVRGIPKSKNIKEIINNAKLLEAKGLEELVITGINIGDYKNGLENLLELLLKNTKQLRIRLSSLRPSRISNRLIELLKEPRLCPHIHTSLQSGSDKVLRLMNRLDYNSKDFLVLNGLINKVLGNRNPFIVADLIAGFPGETEADFMDTIRTLEESSLNKLHVFAYSPRPGTASYSMPKTKTSEIKKRRDLLLEFSQKRYFSSMNKMVGKKIEVLWETQNFGHSENYYPVKGAGVPNKKEIVIVKGIDSDSMELLV